MKKVIKTISETLDYSEVDPRIKDYQLGWNAALVMVMLKLVKGDKK